MFSPICCVVTVGNCRLMHTAVTQKWLPCNGTKCMEPKVHGKWNQIDADDGCHWMGQITWCYVSTLRVTSYLSEMNIPKEIWSSVPDPLSSTIDHITRLCRLSSLAALQAAWSFYRKVGQDYEKSDENFKIGKTCPTPLKFLWVRFVKITSFVTQFIT